MPSGKTDQRRGTAAILVDAEARGPSEDPMTSTRRDTKQSPSDSSEYMRGGKGRKDDVRGSGVYPASSPDAPGGAVVRTAREFVKHTGPKPKGFRRAI
jgi:hypothetical protein